MTTMKHGQAACAWALLAVAYGVGWVLADSLPELVFKVATVVALVFAAFNFGAWNGGAR